MKRLTCLVAIAAFAVLGSIKSPFAMGGPSGPSANGDFQFTLEDGISRSVEFNARIHKDGSSTGEMTFTDPGDPNDPSSPRPAISVKASFDCLTIKDNRAVMSGEITESSVAEAVGHRVLLVVEDDGEGVNTSLDKLTWGVYEPTSKNWIPQDFEIPGDNGALLDWLATDAERSDDVGIAARPNEVIGCKTFSLSAYAFMDVRHGQGNIQVKP
jgi:hypothetical protein